MCPPGSDDEFDASDGEIIHAQVQISDPETGEARTTPIAVHASLTTHQGPLPPPEMMRQ
jgi:hypothetical protein